MFRDALNTKSFTLEDFMKEFAPRTLMRIEVAFVHVTDCALNIHVKNYQTLSAQEMVWKLQYANKKLTNRHAKKTLMDEFKYDGDAKVKANGLSTKQHADINRDFPKLGVITKRGSMELLKMMEVKMIDDFIGTHGEFLVSRDTFRKALQRDDYDYSPYAHRRVKEWNTYVRNRFCPIGIEDATTKYRCLEKGYFHTLEEWDSSAESFVWTENQTTTRREKEAILNFVRLNHLDLNEADVNGSESNSYGTCSEDAEPMDTNSE